jgi:hypothetical protein
MRVLVGSIFALLILAQPAFAKDLTNRMGVGYKSQFSTDIPGIAVQYYPTSDVGVSGTIAVDTEKDNSKFGFMGKIQKIIFKEDNLNFYMGAGAGLISVERASGAATTTDSGFELLALVGTEFFFQGLDSLGFSFETGAGITSISNGVRFRTFGDSPIRAGITFYF